MQSNTTIYPSRKSADLCQARKSHASIQGAFTSIQTDNLTAEVSRNIKVMLVDDHKILRDGLISLLEDAGGITVVAEASGGAEAIRKALEYSPDVVVMDLSMPEIGGIEATRRIVAHNPHMKVLVLSMLIDKHCVLESLNAGARGYLAKDCAAEELVIAIRAIFAGNPYLCTCATEILINGSTPCTSSGRPASTLTKREHEVLNLTAAAYSTKETAFELGISIKMVETHRKNIRKKLGVKNTAQLITYATRAGMTVTE